MPQGTKIHSRIISSQVFSITEDMGFIVVSFVLKSGAGNFTGTQDIGAEISQPIPLTIDEPITIDAQGVKPLELNIEAIGGDIHFIGKQ